MKEELYYFPYDPMRYPFNLEVCGYTEDDDHTPHVDKRENSYMYICEYIVSGSGILSCNNFEYNPKAGDVYILPKNSNHEYYPNPKDPWKKIWFIFDGPLVPNMLHGFGLHNDIFFQNFGHEELFKEMFTMAKSYTNLEDLNFKISMKFYEILMLLNKHKHSQELTDKAEKIQALLDSHIYDKLDLDFIAKEMFLSKAHIINLFREKFGVTPYQYFIQQKLSLAANYLVNSKHPVNEISHMLSFSDHQYFCRIFKKYTGMSPLKFRKSCDNLTYIWAHERIDHSGFLNNFRVFEDDLLRTHNSFKESIE